MAADPNDATYKVPHTNVVEATEKFLCLIIVLWSPNALLCVYNLSFLGHVGYF